MTNYCVADPYLSGGISPFALSVKPFFYFTLSPHQHSHPPRTQCSERPRPTYVIRYPTEQAYHSYSIRSSFTMQAPPLRSRWHRHCLVQFPVLQSLQGRESDGVSDSADSETRADAVIASAAESQDVSSYSIGEIFV